MRKLTIILFSILTMSVLSFAQDFENENKKRLYPDADWYKLMNSDNPNYFEVRDAYTEFFKGRSFKESIETKEYKRWKRRYANSFDSEGNILKDLGNKDDLLLLNKSLSGLKSGDVNQWSCIGPKKYDQVAPMQSQHPVQGVIRSIVQHPTDQNKIWAGSVSAGIWYTANKGETWECVTTDLLISHVKGIAISKSNTDIMYAVTNTGVIKSIDSGLTWEHTTLDFRGEYPHGPEPMQMRIDANDPDKALAASSRGLYKTVDGGQTWDRVFSSFTWDVEYHPTNSEIAYAAVKETADWVYFFKSIDGGSTWTKITDGLPVEMSERELWRMAVCVSPAAPDKVWAIAAGGNTSGSEKIEGIYGFYISEDSGESFVNKGYNDDGPVPGTSSMPNMVDYDSQGLGSGGGQYTWDMDMAVSDVDPDYIIFGGINVWKTENGGTSWQNVPRGKPVVGASWFHYDVQCTEIFGDQTWIGTDGGIHLSTDKSEFVNDVSFGIVAQELWGFDQAWKDDIMGIGMYHGPVMIRDDEIYDGWYVSSGADAGNVMVNKGDDRYLYAHPWSDVKITRSDDRMKEPVIVDLGAKLLSYIHPIEIFDHSYYDVFYTLDGTEVKKTRDNALSWDVVKDFGGGKEPVRIATSYSDHNTVYVVVNWNKVYKTTDGGETWTDKTPEYSVTQGKAISNITIDGEDPDIVWISMKGKQTTSKVLKTINGGASWSDYSGPSGNLPSYAINSIAHQIGTDGGVYIGTDAGVWYRNNSMTDWVNYSNGLPMGLQTWFVRLNYAKEKVRIGTLRGVWECNFYEESNLVANPMVSCDTVGLNKEIRFADHSVCLADASFEWEFEGGEPATSSDEFPIITYANKGSYDVSLTVTDSRGSEKVTFEDMVNVKFIENSDPIPSGDWEVIYVNSEELTGESAPNGPAAAAIDGDPNSFWHTRWSSGSDSYPHEIQVDMKESYNLGGFGYLPRQSGANGRIANYELYISNDENDWGDAISTGTWENEGVEQKVKFDAKEGRYFKLKALSEVQGQNFASAGELYVYEYIEDTSGDGSGGDNTSVDNVVENETQIYSKGNTIYVKYSGDEDYTVEVYNITGHKLSEQRMSRYQQDVQFQNARVGIYIVKVQTESNFFTRKILVK